MAVPHSFLSGSRIDAGQMNENFTYVDGRATTNATNISALQAAPPAHAARHKSGGADALMAVGSVTFTTDGSGHVETGVAHGLSGSPRYAFASWTVYPGGLAPAAYATVSGTTVTVGVSGAAANTSLTVTWWVFL